MKKKTDRAISAKLVPGSKEGWMVALKTAFGMSVSRRIITLCFMMSGFVSLVYEICWIRISSLIFGSTIYATSSVIAVFFGGLTLGNFLAGRFYCHIRKPLLVYAGIELLIGFLVLCNPPLFSAIDTLWRGLYPLVVSHPAILSFFRLCTIILVILPPTLLIGATGPVIIRYFITKDNTISFFIPFLYAVNTFGGLLGCVVGGFVLVRFFGVNCSIYGGGILNIGIGVTALVIQRAMSASADGHGVVIEKVVQKIGPSPKTPLVVSMLFVASGFLALGYEIIWMRYLTLIIYNTIYTYILTLSITLLGIFLGGIVAIFLLEKSKNPLRYFIAAQLLTGLSIVTIMFLPVWFWIRVLNTVNVFAQMGVIALLFLIPSLLTGISFPSVIRAVTDTHEVASRQTGWMTAINTFGGIIGSLCAAFLFLPGIGLQNSIVFFTGASIVVGAVALFALEHRIRPALKIAVVTLSLMAWFFIPIALKTKLPQDFLTNPRTVVTCKEGLNSNFVVTRNESGLTTLEIDRLWQGQSESTHQIMACHIPMIAHRNPRDVLVIGLGAGQTTERFLYYPIDHLTCVDIEKELPQLIHTYFKGTWLLDPRLSLVVDDGRNFIKHTDKRFDIIAVEIGQPFRQGLSSFYTVDFYQQAKQKLKTHGIVCQFMPLIFFDGNEYKSVVSTFLTAFPNSVLWYNYYELIMLGYNDSNRIVVDDKRFTDAISMQRVREDMEYSYWGGESYALNKIQNFMSSVLCGPEQLKQFAATAHIYTDNTPSLEYATALNQHYSVESLSGILSELTKYLSNPIDFFKNGPDSIFGKQMRETQHLNLKNILALEYLQKYSEDNANGEALKKARELNPKNLMVLYESANYYIQQGLQDSIIACSQMIATLNPGDIAVNKMLAGFYLTTNLQDSAEKCLLRIIATTPDVESYTTLSTIFEKKKEPQKAFYMASKAVELNPHDTALKKRLAEVKKDLLNR